MKTSLLFSPLIICLFSFTLNASLHTTDAELNGLELTDSRLTELNSTTPPVCNTPTWPTTSYITQTSAEFSWDYVSGALNYSVQLRLLNGTWYDLPGSPFYNTWVTATGLTPGTTYQWRVRANCGSYQYSNWTSPVSFTTTGAYCTTPGWLFTTNITSTSATFDWDPVNNAQSYSIQWRYAGGTWYDLPGGPWTSTWHTVNGLDPGTAYQWRVRSNCYGGNYSPWSYPASFTTLGYSCQTPTWPMTTNVTQTTASFSWDAVSGALSYTVQVRLLNGNWYDVPGTIYNTWVTATGLSPNTTYQWRVRANCSNWQYSNWTYPINFTTTGASCYAPGWLFTTNITESSATFDWDPVSGAQSYSLQLRLAGGTWYDLQGGPWTGTWHTVTGLGPNTAYQWRVRSNCYGGNYSPWSSPASFTTAGYSCETPTWPMTSNITQYSATFSWDAVPGAQSYSVQTRLLNGTWYDVQGPIYSTWVTVNGFNPNTTYQWRVRANCGNWQYSYWSYPTTFTTNGAYCEAPGWLYTTNITQTSATFDWDPVSGAQSYSLQLRLTGGTWYDVSGGPWTSTWHTVYGLVPGTAYEWRVRSNCYGGNYSPWSYSSGFTTLGYSCVAPSWLYTTNISQTSATLDWAPVSGAQSYSLQLRLAGGTWYDVPGGPWTSTWHTINGLEPGTAYEWRVRTNCYNWNYSNWSYPAGFTTLGYSCYPPGWLYTTNITQSSATFDWAPVSGAQSYSLQLRLAGGTWYDVPGGPWTSTWHTVNALEPGTAYEWRVRTNCYNGNYSSWSWGASFTTLGYSCSMPTWPTTTNITSSSATFSWDAVSGAQSYSVQYRLSNGTWWDVQGPIYSTWVTVTGLYSNTTYQWRVRANCSNWQYSNWTWPTTFTTTGGTSCYASDWLFTTNITQTSATFDWEPVNGAQSYSLQWRIAGGTWYDVSGGPWTQTWHTVNGLEPGTAYEWRVRTNCYNWNYSNWSYPASFTTLGYSCSTPTWPTTSNITQTTATFNWDAVSGAQSYSVQYRLPNGIWWDVQGPIFNTWVTVTGLSPNTTFQWRVRANCSGGQYSSWTWPVNFTTNGSGSGSGNDECANATQLTVNSSCVYTSATTVGATPSTPAPVGGCPSNGYKDVWFKFTMPDGSNPTVTIRTSAGSLYDAVMEVYSGADCGNLTFLDCEDDNTNGNNSTMPVISISGNPNATIVVRVWGYYGTSGTFNICVFNYQSNNYAGIEDPIIDLDNEKPLEIIKTEIGTEETAEVEVASATLHVSPNPTRDVLNITLAQTVNAKVIAIGLHDLSGKSVARKYYQPNDLPAFREQLDVSGLAQGIYLLQVITTDGILTEKIMVAD